MESRSVSEALAAADATRAAEETPGADDRDRAADAAVAELEEVAELEDDVVSANDEEEPEAPIATKTELREFLAGEAGDDVVEGLDKSSGSLPVDDLEVDLDEASAGDGTFEALVDDGLEPEPDLPQAAAPTFQDLRELLTSAEFAASVPAPPELGPWTTWGERRVPAVLLEMMRRGIIREWR
jgi:hypothetical protein